MSSKYQGFNLKGHNPNLDVISAKSGVISDLVEVTGSVLITIMENMYKKTTAYLKEDPKSKFKTTCGVRQGASLHTYKISTI